MICLYCGRLCIFMIIKVKIGVGVIIKCDITRTERKQLLH